LQYPGYYNVKKGEKVWIEETWMCWKRPELSTDDFEKICPNPHPLASSAPAVRAPAASH